MTSDAVQLTVGLPVYNGERYLSAAIDSILGQTFPDFELVISDNASTDRTESICREYAERDPRISVLREPVNRGAAWNHNRLVEVAKGRFFKWVSSDDLYAPEFLERCLGALQEHPEAVLAYPRSIAIDESGDRLYEYSPEWELRSESPAERLREVILKGGHWVNADAVSGVIRTEALRATRRLPAYQGGDKRPLAELSLEGQFLEVPEYLLFRRFHPGSSGRNNPHASGYDRSSVVWMSEFFKGSKLSARLPTWTLSWDHGVTIWASRLPVAQKLRLTGVLVRALRWHRPYYAAEIRALLRAGRAAQSDS